MAPLRRGGWWWSRVTLPLLGMLVMSTALAELRLIHFAQWCAFPRLPGATGPARRRGGLVFVAEFDGDLHEYLAAFGLAVPAGMQCVFGATERFPGPRPTRRLIDYVEHRRVRDLLRWSAYPDATVRDVDAALDVQRQLGELRAIDPSLRPAEFAAACRALVASLHRAPRTVRQSQWRCVWAALTARRRVDSFTAALPLAPGGAERVADAVARHPDLFAAVSGTHFARLAHLALPPAERVGAGPDPGRLLVAAFVDGRGRDYPGRLIAALGPVADEVFGGCDGYPGAAAPEAAAAWLARHRLGATLFVPCRSVMPVASVRRALARRERVLDLVADAPPGESFADLGARLVQV
jgi:hypothetical protein